MKYVIEPRRSQKRLSLSIKVRVTCHVSATKKWVEVTDLQDVTQCGARFTVSRPIEKGQLLHLSMAMPYQLRLYDFNNEHYTVWALIRHVRVFKLFAGGGPTAPQYEAGVAFIGKNPPEGYEDDLTLRYELAPPAEEEVGMWRAYVPEEEEIVPEEITLLAGLEPLSPLAPKHELRRMPIELLIEVLGANGDIIASEETITRHITKHDAVVPTTLALKQGQLVRLTSIEHNVSVTAMVSKFKKDNEDIMRLQLRFLDGQLPIESDE